MLPPSVSLPGATAGGGGLLCVAVMLGSRLVVNDMAARRGTTVRDRHRKIISAGHPACGLCGKPIDYGLKYPDPGAFVVDHIVPIAAGGSDRLENKQAAHNACNASKSDHMFDARCLRVSGTIA